ncbi:T9SS type A sorting domain-containing protein [Polluticoccus soli]|uniref:T9SS type A sorting domain-containing protein n=1 Tax=Polluticoccus soli TaxID=3034150 RepID=UPI0023E0E60C|nr:T9SS type A sorting domain-containing protein [Flavipsychrobacter sp. JY13-12]
MINVLPNPSGHSVSISYELETERPRCAIVTNMTGAAVYTAKDDRSCESGSIELDIQSWPAGMYIIRMQTGIETVIRSFFKL